MQALKGGLSWNELSEWQPSQDNMIFAYALVPSRHQASSNHHAASIMTSIPGTQNNYTTVQWHYNDVIMGTIASLITSFTIVYWSVYLGADQRKHQSSASLAFVRGIHRWPVNSPHKWPVTRNMFPFGDVIMETTVSFHPFFSMKLKLPFKTYFLKKIVNTTICFSNRQSIFRNKYNKTGRHPRIWSEPMWVCSKVSRLRQWKWRVPEYYVNQYLRH